MNIIDYLAPAQKKKLKYIKPSKGTTLFLENDKCSSIGIVINGQVSIVSYLNDGKEIIYNVLKENEIFGNNLIFSSDPYYKGNIITNEDSLIAMVSKKHLCEILSSNNKFMIEYLRISSDFAKKLNNNIKLLSIDNVEERFLFYLHEHQNKIEYSSISSLASLIYVERETLSRLISKLLKQNKIIKKDKTIELL